MPYTAIMSWDHANRVSKLMGFDEQSTAATHVATYSDIWPAAFVVETPIGSVEHWVVDPDNRTVSVSLPTLTLEHTSAKVGEAWAEQERRFAESSVMVDVNGASRAYGCDSTTRENITAIVNGITADPTMVPNPRPFTPKGQVIPVDTTHDEFKAIYFAGLAQGDAFFAAYSVHKVAINNLTTVAEVDAYDLNLGWP